MRLRRMDDDVSWTYGHPKSIIFEGMVCYAAAEMAINIPTGCMCRKTSKRPLSRKPSSLKGKIADITENGPSTAQCF